MSYKVPGIFRHQILFHVLCTILLFGVDLSRGFDYGRV
jgi:hypothetical protein